MTELAVVRLRTIVRLGEALPVVFFSSAVDFILPVNCRRAAVDNCRSSSPQAGRHAAAQLQVSSSCRRYPTLLERQLSTAGS